MNDRHLLYAALAALLLADPAPAWAGNERVTTIRSSGRSFFANLVDPATQTSGFLYVARDAIAGTTVLDFSWVTPVPGDERHVVLIQGSGEIPQAALAAGRDDARLHVVTPFETLRCVVDIVDNIFQCELAPALAFDLTWARLGFDTTWEQRVSEYRLGPLSVRQQGQFEDRLATVTGTFGGLPTIGGLGNLFDTRGATVTREVRMKTSR